MPRPRLRFDHDEMTQQELGDRVGVTRQTIIAIEAGKYESAMVLGMRIARLLGVSIEQVFELKDGAG